MVGFNLGRRQLLLYTTSRIGRRRKYKRLDSVIDEVSRLNSVELLVPSLLISGIPLIFPTWKPWNWTGLEHVAIGHTQKSGFEALAFIQIDYWFSMMDFTLQKVEIHQAEDLAKMAAKLTEIEQGSVADEEAKESNKAAVESVLQLVYGMKPSQASNLDEHMLITKCQLSFSEIKLNCKIPLPNILRSFQCKLSIAFNWPPARYAVLTGFRLNV